MLKKNTLIIFMIFFFSIFAECCFAKCPMGILKIIVQSNKPEITKLYAEIKKGWTVQKADLLKVDEGIFQGEIEYSTIGLVIFIELSCSYFPDEITIYSNEGDKKVFPLDEEAIKKNHSWPDDEFNIILQY